MAKDKRKRENRLSEAEAVALIAGALVLGGSARSIANILTKPLGIPVSILVPVLKLALSRPLTYGIATLPSASASSESQQLEATYRAHYVYAASQRLLRDNSPAALKRERQYFEQHLHAMRNRRDSAAQVDRAAKRYGPELGWYAKMDALTSEECREANGKNFNVTRIPAIGFPGAVHPHCRCKAGKRHATSQSVYNVKPRAA